MHKFHDHQQTILAAGEVVEEQIGHKYEKVRNVVQREESA